MSDESTYKEVDLNKSDYTAMSDESTYKEVDLNEEGYSGGGEGYIKKCR